MKSFMEDQCLYILVSRYSRRAETSLLSFPRQRDPMTQSYSLCAVHPARSITISEYIDFLQFSVDEALTVAGIGHQRIVTTQPVHYSHFHHLVANRSSSRMLSAYSAAARRHLT